MRRILTGFAVAALMAVVPTMVLAGNQEMADQIAQRLRSSGQLSGYKIGIKCQEGTAWLRGRVTSEEQMNTALKLTFQTPGVTRIVNELAVAAPESTAQKKSTTSAQQSTSTASANRSTARAGQNPLRGQTASSAAKTQKESSVKRLESMARTQESTDEAERVSASYRSAPATKVSAEEMQEEMPQQIRTPSRAKPMASNRVAMQQGTRGPAAYNNGRPMPAYTAARGAGGVAPARYDQPCMPNYAWPSYAAYPNYAAVTYPKQYSATAWPYIGPFYPYPQVPMGWRKVTLEWDDGWWFLDFKDQPASCWHR